MDGKFAAKIKVPNALLGKATGKCGGAETALEPILGETTQYGAACAYVAV